MKGITLWFTGLSGAGKSTLANELKNRLGDKVVILDGDVIRKNFCNDSDFSREGIRKNNRILAFIAKQINSVGGNVIVAAISPFKEDRSYARELISEVGLFYEVYINCPLEILMKRDVKGFYKKISDGKIDNFIGIHTPYEAPDNPEIIIHSDKEEIGESITKILEKTNL